MPFHFPNLPHQSHHQRPARIIILMQDPCHAVSSICIRLSHAPRAEPHMHHSGASSR